MDTLTIENISKSYGNHVALQDVSLKVPSECIYGLLGPNGAGKSTLIRIITQIIEADKGNIYINGENLKREHVKLIGYLPEERGLYKKMKVGEQLLYLAQLKRLSKENAISKVNTWLERLDMQTWYNRKIEDLSKGMQQKVQFIAAVVHDPSIIILDEPFSGFDPVNSELITKEILRLKETGCTIIFSTHRMETVEELCDNVALIDRSKKIIEGSKDEIKKRYATNTFLIKHLGEAPYSTDLYQTINRSFAGNNCHNSEIAIKNGFGISDVMAELAKSCQVVSINERTISIKDIFIKLVSAPTYE